MEEFFHPILEICAFVLGAVTLALLMYSIKLKRRVVLHATVPLMIGAACHSLVAFFLVADGWPLNQSDRANTALIFALFFTFYGIFALMFLMKRGVLSDEKPPSRSVT